jgi:hypothetical protein
VQRREPYHRVRRACHRPAPACRCAAVAPWHMILEGASRISWRGAQPIARIDSFWRWRSRLTGASCPLQSPACAGCDDSPGIEPLTCILANPPRRALANAARRKGFHAVQCARLKVLGRTKICGRDFAIATVMDSLCYSRCLLRPCSVRFTATGLVSVSMTWHMPANMMAGRYQSRTGMTPSL